MAVTAEAPDGAVSLPPGLVLGSTGTGATTVAGDVAVGSVVDVGAGRVVAVGTDGAPGRLDGKNPTTPEPAGGALVVVVVVGAVVVVVVVVAIVELVPPAPIAPVPAVVVVIQSNVTELLDVCPAALVASSAVPPAPIMRANTAMADLLLRIMVFPFQSHRAATGPPGRVGDLP